MSDARGIWGLRALALVLASLAWFFFALSGREVQGQKVIEAFVTYNTSKDLMILDPVEKVRVIARGPSSKLGGLVPFQVGVTVDLRTATKGNVEVNLGPENVSLPEELQVVSIEPHTLLLTLDRVVTDMRPVEPRLTGEPAAGAVVKVPQVVPSLVMVRGPASRLEQLTSLHTSPVSLDGHAIDFEEQAFVVSPDPLVTPVQPALVTVRVPMEVPPAGGAQ